MASKPWVAKPQIMVYVLVTVILTVLLSLTVLWISKVGLPTPNTAVSTQKLTTETLPSQPSAEFKIAVQNEIDKVSTISARLKTMSTWTDLDLPKLDLAIDF